MINIILYLNSCIIEHVELKSLGENSIYEFIEWG